VYFHDSISLFFSFRLICLSENRTQSIQLQAVYGLSFHHFALILIFGDSRDWMNLSPIFLTKDEARN
jgi:hypothetical protein